VTTTCAISVLIATRNEEKNLPRCLEALKGWADEIVVIDSQSDDRTIEIANSFGAKVVQFYYKGGWPKKRQWALDQFPWRNDWILILDADEILLPEIRSEIRNVITNTNLDGYWVKLRIVFLGRMLRYGGAQLWKLCLFRKGKGRFEQRLQKQDSTMSDIEIHEHVILDGSAGSLQNVIRHENYNTLDRYILKHNEYSNWESNVYLYGGSELEPRLFGNQAQRRRWLKMKFMMVPGAVILRFLQTYILNLGFLDGLPGFYYSGFKAVQMFHVKAKIYELKHKSD
jgi:glycosyltransferase involved in cell wall biosynthesis